MKKIPLHWQIVIGLVLGAIFGGLFPVSKTGIEIVLQKQTVEIEHWQSAIVRYDTLSTTFQAGERDALAKSVAALKLPVRHRATLIVVMPDGAQRQFTDIVRLKKPMSIAAEIKPVGTLFLNLLKMIAVPLVLASLIVGASSLGDVRQMARIGGKTIGLYLVTTALAIIIGLVVANVLQPGYHMPAGASEKLMNEFSGAIADKVSQELDFSVLDFLLNIVPTNPFTALAGGDMLHIVFFAVFLGLILSVIPQQKSEPVIRFFDGLSEASIRMVEVVMLAAPLGVFALMAVTIADFGFEILLTLIWYVAAVVFGLLLHVLVVYMPLLVFRGKTKLSTFTRGFRRAQLLAFSTSSSAATLPVTMECVEEMGVPNKIASFVLPLGATINMDGTALYQGIAAVFIAQVYGIPLDLGAQLTIILTATLASIGTAPVPGVGIIMLIIVLRSVGIPEEGIALILGVDRLLDMMRTVVNITGDAVVAVVVAAGENALGKPHLTDDGLNYPLTKE
jgi:proton glutamate symport protein